MKQVRVVAALALMGPVAGEGCRKTPTQVTLQECDADVSAPDVRLSQTGCSVANCENMEATSVYSV